MRYATACKDVKANVNIVLKTKERQDYLERTKDSNNSNNSNNNLNVE